MHVKALATHLFSKRLGVYVKDVNPVQCTFADRVPVDISHSLEILLRYWEWYLTDNDAPWESLKIPLDTQDGSA